MPARSSRGSWTKKLRRRASRIPDWFGKDKSWDDQGQAYYLAAIRLSLVAGDLATAKELIVGCRPAQWHAEQQAVLRTLVDRLPDSAGRDADPAFEAFFDQVRDPVYHPKVFTETSVLRFEFGATRDRWFSKKTGRIDWKRVITGGVQVKDGTVGGSPMDGVIPISMADCEGVIFPAACVPRHLDANGGAWTPTLEQVADAERRLPAYLATANPRVPSTIRPGVARRIMAKLDRYARQYFGITRAGRRSIYINCLPTDHRSDWRAQPVFVRDGGEEFFQLIFDLESAEFTGMWVNGEA